MLHVLLMRVVGQTSFEPLGSLKDQEMGLDQIEVNNEENVAHVTGLGLK